MAEEKKLYEASFRGVPFHVTKVDLKVGRSFTRILAR